MSEGSSGLDFRKGMIRKRLENVKRVLLVLSGKGGVGKSVVSATLAAMLAESGLKVGLLDADLYGPSSALLFNARGFPAEGESGLIPPVAGGVKLMSVDLFASGRPIPLTGSAAEQVVLELLALTDWGRLDYLIVDMPPATGDIMMTLTSLGKKGLAAVVVTMPDRLSTTVAHRVLELLQSGDIPTVGVLGNMMRPRSSGACRRAGTEETRKGIWGSASWAPSLRRRSFEVRPKERRKEPPQDQIRKGIAAIGESVHRGCRTMIPAPSVQGNQGW